MCVGGRKIWPMPKSDLNLHDASPATGISVAYTNQGVAICLHDKDGSIFAYAILEAERALRILASAQVACMEVTHGVQAHGQVGHG